MTECPTISAIVLIRNHAPHIRPCLATLAWVDEIVVVSDGSEDGSVAIAREFSNARVVHRALGEDWSAQMNFGLDQATSAWLFQIDVDERVPSPLAAELQRLIHRTDINGINLRILGDVFGHLQGHRSDSGRAVRLVRRGRGRFEAKRVHARLQVNGRVAAAQEVLVHLGPFPTVESYWTKNAFYARLEAATNLERMERSPRNSCGTAMIEALLKPMMVFLKKYVFEGGWREGLFGLHYSIMRAIGYYMVAVASWERRQQRRSALRAYCLAENIPYLDPTPVPSLPRADSVPSKPARMASNR
ncbi:glycosyl transferase [Nitrospira sp.]|nr:glycosyl transferase [Nitrospira sp.]